MISKSTPKIQIAAFKIFKEEVVYQQKKSSYCVGVGEYITTNLPLISVAVTLTEPLHPWLTVS